MSIAPRGGEDSAGRQPRRGAVLAALTGGLALLVGAAYIVTIAPGGARAALRQLWAARHQGYLRWRLETFGLYQPSQLHERPWWRVNPAALSALCRLLPHYLAWLDTIWAIRSEGARGDWRRRLGANDETWRAALAHLEDA